MHPDEETRREEEETNALLRQLDGPEPRVDFRTVVDRAGRGKRAGIADRRLLRVAAGLFVVAGIAGVAYALPGSPLPRWVDHVIAWVGGGGADLRPAPDPAGDSDAGGAGIAVTPGSRLLILFESPQGTARVSLTDDPEVIVRAPAHAATFTSGADRLVIGNHGPVATFEIQIPRAAPRVEIFVGRTRLFLKEAGGVAVPPAADSSGVYVLRLNPSGS